jgi:hypothetical protein
VSPRSAALAEATRLVGIVRTPEVASKASDAPAPALRQPPSEPSSPYLLDVHRWWSLPIPMSTTQAWLEAHPPVGLQLSGGGSGTDPDGATLYLMYRDAPPSSSYTYAMLLISVASDRHGGSAIRADGQTVWVPPRPTAEDVASDVTSVRLGASDGFGTNATTVARRILTGNPAARLVRLANELLRDNRGPVSCAFDTGDRRSATFVSSVRTLTFTETPACGSVSVTSDGASLPALMDSPAFHRAITTGLGLR